MSMHDENNAISVSFDPSFLMVSMELWRDATDLNIPVADNFKVHFITRRRSLLAGFEKTATAWAMMLDAMRAPADGPHQARLEECSDKVQEFKLWAKTELEKMEQVAIREEMDDTLQDGLQQLARDPAGRALIEKMIKGGIFKAPPGGQKKGGKRS